MNCPSCSQPVPPQSKFCLHCGFRIHRETVAPVIKSFPLLSLEVVEFRACGPIVVEKGYLNERLRRGFEFAIALRDSSGKEIRTDGELVAALRGPYPNASTGPHTLEPSPKTARSIGARTDILWHRNFALKKSDFVSRTIRIPESVNDNQESLQVYAYHEVAPILSVDADYCVELHAWFMMPTNQCLYRAATTVWSR